MINKLLPIVLLTTIGCVKSQNINEPIIIEIRHTHSIQLNIEPPIVNKAPVKTWITGLELQRIIDERNGTCVCLSGDPLCDCVDYVVYGISEE